MPDPRGPLSNVISLAIIVATNNEVYKVLESRLDRSLTCEPSEKRGAYNKYTPEFKATTAKYAIENGNSRAARKFSTTDMAINESTIRSWVATYKKELERKRKAGEDSAISSLQKRTWSSFTAGDTLDNQVKEYVRSVREGGGLITTEITIAAAKAIVRKYNPQLLADDEGP